MALRRYITNWSVLAVILCLAFVLRVYHISAQDIVGDEVAYSFRSIGLLDYLGTNFQTQPIDWYKDGNLPWWTHLSFHDHPPLSFLIQHFFFALFGHSILVAKAPSILFGLLSVVLIFLIVKRNFPNANESRLNRVSILAALIFAINSASVWVFRTSLIEPFLIFFILLAIYLFFIYVEKPKYFWAYGVSLGLVALTKYIGVFILPAFILYALILERKMFRRPGFYAALLIALIVFSPVVVYNIFMYKARGHFDLQFAYALHQKTPEWSGLVGKVEAPFPLYFDHILKVFDLPLLLVVIFGILGGIYLVWQRKNFKRVGDSDWQLSYRGVIFWMLYAVMLTLTFVYIGVGYRFLSLYAPIFSVFSAFILSWLWDFHKKYKLALRIFAVAFLIFELWFAVKANFIEVNDYGLSQLDYYFEDEFRGKESGVTPQSDNYNLNDVINEFAAQKQKNLPRHLSAIVYNDNVDWSILGWIYYRRFFYDSIPTMFVENYERALREGGPDYFKRFTVYFVQSTPNTLLNAFKVNKKAADLFEAKLRASGLVPAKIIYGSRGKEMFRVYKFRA